jgi:hypothetical protein
MMTTIAGHHEGRRDQAGQRGLSGHHLRLAAAREGAYAKVILRRAPSIERPMKNCPASSCVPYKSGFILNAVEATIHPCSAVTSSATRWTQPPP